MNDWLNKAIVGDNLEVMKQLPSNSIDLIYCDILYGTGRNFRDYQDIKPKRDIVEAFYIPRIKGMHQLLKDTGSIYLQMDTRINHWVRCIMDDVFGYDRFLNELIWCYNTQGYSKSKYSSKHDSILFYSKTKKHTFNLETIRNKNPSESTVKRFGKEIEKNGFFIDTKSKKKVYELKGSPPLDWFEMSVLPYAHKENTGYDTQKPKALLQRIIKASSNKGDIVADFFCGSGTTLEAANELERNFFGCDINPKAIEITNSRIKSSLFSTV
jgi:site-specific DNA-methyltransferase (adenine-specific)